MKTSDNLFQLIKSMGKAEKGYFKKYSSLHTIGGMNNYVKLFDVIEKQTERSQTYDEQLVHECFNEKFNRQLPVVKNYLYKAVLESLQMYHGGNNAELRVESLIEQYDILFSKVLIKQAGEILKRARKIAEEHEFFPEMLKILNREKQFFRAATSAAEFEIKHNKIVEEENEILVKIKNVNEFSDLRYKIVQFTHTWGTGFARDQQQHKQLIDFLNDPLLESESRALSKSALRVFHQTRSNIYSYLGEQEQSYKYALKYKQLIEEDLGKTATPNSLLVSLNNILTFQIRLKMPRESLETLDKIKNFEKIYAVALNEKEKAFKVHSQIMLELSICMEFGFMEQGLLAAKEAEILLTDYESKIERSRILIVYYFLASFLFSTAKYAESSKWISKILLFPASDFSSDYQCYARLMNLIVHYELKNFDHFDYAMKSTYYFLRKRNKIYKYEQIIIKYMKRAIRVNTQAGLIDMFDEMKSELELIYTDNFEKNGFDAFNLIPWLEKKIEGSK